MFTRTLKIVVATMFLTGVQAAQSAPIPVANAGFEDPVLADFTHTSGQVPPVPGWTATSTPDAIVFNPPVSYFTAGPAEGNNALFADGRYDAWGSTAKATQINLATIDVLKQYELKVMVGQDAQSTLFGDYTISLLKDGVVAASISNFGGGTGATPAPDSWSDVMLLYTPLSGDAGMSLGIRLESGTVGTASAGSRTWFDNVRLTSIPEPTGLAVLGLAALPMMRRRSR